MNEDGRQHKKMCATMLHDTIIMEEENSGIVMSSAAHTLSPNPTIKEKLGIAKHIEFHFSMRIIDDGPIIGMRD